MRAGEFGHRGPSALPDGRHVLFSSEPAAALIADVATGAITEVRRHAAGARFIAPHWVLFVDSDAGPLYAQPLDLGHLRVDGAAQRVLDRVESVRGAASYTAASDVLVALDRTLSAVAPRVLWVDRQAVIDAAWGPGDSLLAYGTACAGPVALGCTTSRPTPPTHSSPADGGSSVPPTGPPTDASSPSRRARLERPDAGDLDVLPRHAASHPHVADVGQPWHAALVTRRTVACLHLRRDRRDGGVRAPSCGPRRAVRVSPTGGQFPSWQADGRALRFQRGDGTLVSVGVTLGAATVRFGATRVVLASAPFARAEGGIVVTAGGDRFIGFAGAPTSAFTLLLGWRTGLTPP